MEPVFCLRAVEAIHQTCQNAPEVCVQAGQVGVSVQGVDRPERKGAEGGPVQWRPAHSWASSGGTRWWPQTPPQACLLTLDPEPLSLVVLGLCSHQVPPLPVSLIPFDPGGSGLTALVTCPKTLASEALPGPTFPPQLGGWGPCLPPTPGGPALRGSHPLGKCWGGSIEMRFSRTSGSCKMFTNSPEKLGGGRQALRAKNWGNSF